MGFCEGEDTNSLIKEIGTSSNGSHSTNKERDLEYTTDPNHLSIAVQKKIITTTDGLGIVASAGRCKISVETNREGVVILDGGLVPYKKGGSHCCTCNKILVLLFSYPSWHEPY